jgi:hypothetical protein
MEHAIDPPALQEQLDLAESRPQFAYQLRPVGPGLVKLGEERIELGGRGTKVRYGILRFSGIGDLIVVDQVVDGALYAEPGEVIELLWSQPEARSSKEVCDRCPGITL